MNNENLKPFVKGDPRINRKGRPKLPDIDEILTELLAEEVGGEDAVKRIIKGVIDKALKGDIKSAEWLFNRAYGKPRQSKDKLTATPGGWTGLEEQPLLKDPPADGRYDD